MSLRLVKSNSPNSPTPNSPPCSPQSQTHYDRVSKLLHADVKDVTKLIIRYVRRIGKKSPDKAKALAAMLGALADEIDNPPT